MLHPGIHNPPETTQDQEEDTSAPINPDSVQVGGTLEPIPEEVGDLDAEMLTLEDFYEELMDDIPITENDAYHDIQWTHCAPVQVMPENTLLFTTHDEEDTAVTVDAEDTFLTEADEEILEDELGKYVELCFTEEMASVILDERDRGDFDPKAEVATIRVYISEDFKRAVVVKADDIQLVWLENLPDLFRSRAFAKFNIVRSNSNRNRLARLRSG